MVEILNAAAALLVGIVTGFFFERRANAATRRRNRELEDELETLRHAVYSMGGQPHTNVNPEGASTRATPDEVHRRALSVQSSEGRVQIASLVAHFVGKGCTRADIEKAIEQLASEGQCRVDGKWMEMT